VIPDADVAVELERMVAGHPHLTMAQLSTVDARTDVRSGADGRAAEPLQLPITSGPNLRDRAQQIDTMALRAITIASMLPDDDTRPQDWTTTFGRLISPSYSDLDVNRSLREIDAELDAIATAIEMPETFTFTLTGRSSELDLRIINTGDTELAVVLEPESSKLAFPDGAVSIVLNPGLNVIRVPVQTLTNGTFPVTVSAQTPTGAVQIGEPLTLTARVNAVTGLGQVLTVGALLVLLSWWYGHLRGRRRRLAGEHETQCRGTHPSGRPGPADPADTVHTP
jgi:hypothetical protein